MISQDKLDAVHNALVVGMSLPDAYAYAGLTPLEMQSLDKDEEYQSHASLLAKGLEYSLLARMNEISQLQAGVGKETATTWMLEHLFPRYTGKQGEVGGTIVLNIQHQEDDDECLEIHKNSQSV